jgi:uncharacterized protein YlxW (UPF0749 family)
MKLKAFGFFILCLAVGFSLIVQARVINGQQLYVSSKAISDYKTTIESEKEDMKRIGQLTVDTGKKLQEYQALASGESSELKNRLVEEHDYYKLISGNTAVHGEGVVVYVDDGTRDLMEGEDPNTVLVHDIDILTILNELDRSGAEVLSVNGQRITNETAISCSGYTVRINNQFFARPFEIHAIGDSKRMAAALIGPDGYGTLLQDFGVIFKVTIKEDIVIPKYAEDISFHYMNKVKEEE